MIVICRYLHKTFRPIKLELRANTVPGLEGVKLLRAELLSFFFISNPPIPCVSRYCIIYFFLPTLPKIIWLKYTKMVFHRNSFLEYIDHVIIIYNS